MLVNVTVVPSFNVRVRLPPLTDEAACKALAEPAPYPEMNTPSDWVKLLMMSCAPPTACLKKTKASDPDPPVMSVDPAADPAIKVSLPLPAVIITVLPGVVTLAPIDSQIGPAEPDAFSVSLPPAATTVLEPPPITLTWALDAPNTVAVPEAPVLTVELLELPTWYTSPPGPAFTELAPGPPMTDDVGLLLPAPPTMLVACPDVTNSNWPADPYTDVAEPAEAKIVSLLAVAPTPNCTESAPVADTTSLLPPATNTSMPVPLNIEPAPVAVIVSLPVPPASRIDPAPDWEITLLPPAATMVAAPDSTNKPPPVLEMIGVPEAAVIVLGVELSFATKL